MRWWLTRPRCAAPSSSWPAVTCRSSTWATLMNALDVPLVFVPGNHDPDVSGYRSSRAGLTLKAGLPARPPWPDGAVNADGRIIDVAGLRLAGLGGCLRYSDGPNQYTDRAAGPARPGAARPGAVARGSGTAAGSTCCSRTRRRAGVGDGDDPPHRGFEALHGLVAALQPAAAAARARASLRRARPAAPARAAPTVRNVTGWHLLDIEPGAGAGRAAPAVVAMPDTGFPRADVENDFLRARRRQVLARLAQRLRRGPDDVNLILPFDEVVAALGMRGERRLGLQTIRLDTIVGTLDSRPGLRPPVPAHRGPGQGALGAAGPGPAPRRADPAHRRVPHRRPALRAGRPSPGVDRDGDRGRRRSRLT